MSILDFEDLYRRSQSPGSAWAGASEADVARAAAWGGNQGAALWEEMQGSPVKRAAYWWADKVDDLAQATGLAELGAAMGRGGAGLVGSENVGQWEEAGRGMAGDVLSMLPLAIPFVGPVAGPVSMAANTLGKTGDYTSAAISAAMPSAMKFVGGAAGNAFANMVGRQAGSFGDTIATIAGSQLGTGVAGLGVDIADTVRQGGGVDDILNKDFLGMSLLGNLPFAGLDLLGAPGVRKQRIEDANRRAAVIPLETKNEVLMDKPSTELVTTPVQEPSFVTDRKIKLTQRSLEEPLERPAMFGVKLDTMEERGAYQTLVKQGVDKQAAKLFVFGMRGKIDLPKIAEGRGKELVEFVKSEWEARRDRTSVDSELSKKAVLAGLTPEIRRDVERKWQMREAAYDLETAKQAFPDIWRRQQIDSIRAIRAKLRSKSPKDKAQLREQLAVLERDLNSVFETPAENRGLMLPQQRAERYGYAPGDEVIQRELERKKVIIEEQNEVDLRELETIPDDFEVIHYSKEPLALRSDFDQYNPDNVYGKGLYAMEPGDERMWTQEMGRISLGEHRNVLKAKPKNPLVITPKEYKSIFNEAVKQKEERGYQRLVLEYVVKERMQQGGHDAVVVRGFDATKTGQLQKQVADETEAKLAQKFSAGAPKDEAYWKQWEQISDEVAQRVAGMSSMELFELANMQNQVYVPPEKASDVFGLPIDQQQAAVQPEPLKPEAPSNPFFEAIQDAIDAGAIPEENAKVLMQLGVKLNKEGNSHLADPVINELIKVVADSNNPVTFQGDPTALAKEIGLIWDRVRKRKEVTQFAPESVVSEDVRTVKARDRWLARFSKIDSEVKASKDPSVRERWAEGNQVYSNWLTRLSDDAAWSQRHDNEMMQVFVKWFESGKPADELTNAFVKKTREMRILGARVIEKELNKLRKFADDPSEQDGWEANVGRTQLPTEGEFGYIDSPDTQTVLTNILRRHGLDYDTATRLVTPALKVARLIKDFTSFKVGELVTKLSTDDGRQLLGLANVRSTARGIYVKALEGPMSNKRRANILTFTTAHELFHLFDADGRAGRLPEQLQRLRDQFVTDLNDTGVSTRRALMRTFIDDYMPRSMRDDPEVINNIMNEANIRDTDEFLANVHAMMSMKLMRGGFVESLRFLPDSLRSYMSKAISFGRDVLDSIRGLFAPSGEDMTNIRSLSESYRRLARQIVKQERDLERTQFVVSQLEPGGFVDTITHQKSFGEGDFAPLLFGQTDQIKDSTLKRAAKGMGKIFAPVQTLAHFASFAEPAIKHVTFERQRMQQIIHKSREFFMKNPDGTDNPTPPIADIMRSPSLSHAHQKVRIILGRNLGDANMKMILEDVGHPDHAELKNTFDSLDSVEKKVLQEYLQQTRDAHRYVTGEYVESAWKSKEHLVGALALRAGKSKSLNEATEFGQRFLGELRSITEPEQLQAWAEQTLQADPSMEPFVKVGVKLWEWSNAFEGYVNDPRRVEYISERRNKEWLVQFVTDKNETGSIDFDTEVEALEFKKNPSKFLPKGVDYTVKSTLKPWNTRMKAREKIKQSEMDALINNAADKRRELMEIMQSEMGVDAEAAKLMSRHLDDLVVDVHRASLAQNPMELGVTRNAKPGRELLNYVEQQIEWITRIAVGNSRRETDSYMKMVEADPAFLTEDGVWMKQNLYEHIENMRTPDTEAGKMFSRANFLWRLGLNMSSHIVEAISWPLIAAPSLMARGAGFSEAFKLGSMASRYAFRYITKDLGGRGAQKYEKLMGNDPEFGREVDELVKTAQDAGLLHMHQQYDTDFDEIYTNIESMRKVFAGMDDIQADTTQFKVFDQAYKLASKVYQPFTRANAHVNLIMFYAHEKKVLAKQGYKGEELLRKARENAMFYSSQANSSQGKGGRPIGLGGGKGFTRTLGMSMLSLQSFVLGHMANQIGYIKNALDKTVDPSVRAANKKAAMTSLGLHFAAAGALGLPGVGIITGLASSLFGVDFEKESREWMTNDGQDDPLMADLVWHGLPFAMGVVPDIGSKLQAGGVSGFNSFNGWTGESMLGAIGAFAGDVRRAAGAAQEQGWTSGLAELLPSSVKNAMKVSSNGGQIVGRDGTPIYTPEGLESVALALGFQVNQFVRQRRAAQAGELVRQSDARSNQRIADELSDMIVRGADPRLVKAKLREYTSDPEIQKTLLRNTVDRAGQKVFGRDPLNKATRGTFERISAINRAYGVAPRPVDEAQRVQYKQQISNSLGLQTNPKQVGEAMLIDEIRRANPFMTTFEARQLLKNLRS